MVVPSCVVVAFFDCSDEEVVVDAADRSICVVDGVLIFLSSYTSKRATIAVPIAAAISAVYRSFLRYDSCGGKGAGSGKIMSCIKIIVPESLSSINSSSVAVLDLHEAVQIAGLYNKLRHSSSCVDFGKGVCLIITSPHN